MIMVDDNARQTLVKAPATYPILTNKTRVPEYMSKPYPDLPLVHPTEYYRFIDDYVVPNIMPMRYLISNFGNTYDRALDKPIPMKVKENDYISFKVAYYQEWNKLGVKDVYLHRAVMITFAIVPNYQNIQVNHLNGIKNQNDYPGNLEWQTPSGNMQHAVATGLIKTGLENPRTKLNLEQIKNVCERLCNGEPCISIANDLNVSESLISGIKQKRFFTDVSQFYPLPDPVALASKLPDETVHAICQDIAAGMRGCDIQKKYNIPRYVLNDIKFRRNYTHISKDYEFPEFKKQKTYSDVDYHRVCQLLTQDITLEEINQMTGMSTTTIRKLHNGSLRPDISSQYQMRPVKDYNLLTEYDAAIIMKYLSLHPEMNNTQIANELGYLPYNVRDIRLRRSFSQLADSLGYSW